MEKILVASSGNTLDAKVSGRFGHAAYFLVVNPATMSYEAFQGVAQDESPEVRRYIQTGINKVIVGNIGPANYDELRAYGCKVYLCRNMQVDEAVQKVYRGEIQPMDAPTLKDSIYSAQKNLKETSEGSLGQKIENGIRRIFGRAGGRGMGAGMGGGGSRGMGGGNGSGKGSGSGRGMGGGNGSGMGSGGGRGMGGGNGSGMGSGGGRGMGGGQGKGGRGRRG
ncbi:MAG: NifB/NifX family molybdenum-iron cluster-binding protein [Bacteroidales bacterium]|nr:NifB/NifX family molybdenum-iron cluster-binding protein [Bacteroidales bacterium]